MSFGSFSLHHASLLPTDYVFYSAMALKALDQRLASNKSTPIPPSAASPEAASHNSPIAASHTISPVHTPRTAVPVNLVSQQVSSPIDGSPSEGIKEKI